MVGKEETRKELATRIAMSCAQLDHIQMGMHDKRKHQMKDLNSQSVIVLAFDRLHMCHYYFIIYLIYYKRLTELTPFYKTGLHVILRVLLVLKLISF